MPEVENSAGSFLEDDTDRSSIPSAYFNGFEFSMSLSDVCVIAQLNGKRKQQLHMSFTTAKELMVGMQQLIAHIERASGLEIPTMQQMNAALAAAQEAAAPAASDA